MTAKQFKRLLLHLSGMRVTEEYELVLEGETATISHYYFNYASGEERRVLEGRGTLSFDDAQKQLKEFGVDRWNGFEGKHPWGVLDGTMFTLEGEFEDDGKFYAHGSQNFPKHFREFENWLLDNIESVEE